MTIAPQLPNALREEFLAELHSIANWWIEHCQDEIHGGFVGEISVDNQVNPAANKGIILNSRILWFFSEVSIFTRNIEYTVMADRAYDYLTRYFVDRIHGGVFWEINCAGEVVNGRKQTYAQAFALYGLSAYFKLTGNKEALSLAKNIYHVLETRTHDNRNAGYLEAFARDWSPIEDVRLSPLDLNSPKSMNTHLHVLEAYTALQVAAPEEAVANSIKRCLDYFDTYIINRENYHLRMFQSVDWKDESTSISYGHDIECSWLIREAVEVLRQESLIAYFRESIVNLTRVCLEEAIGEYGEVLDAYNFKTGRLSGERMWWVQAEAMVGFLNAYQMTGEKKYFRAFANVWEFIKKYQKDREHGEWHWLSTLDLPKRGDCKIGFWKAPYHNGRATMEVCRRLDELSRTGLF